MKTIILFASGAGSNAAQVMQYFGHKEGYRVAGLFTNNPNARAIEKAGQYNVPAIVFTKEELSEGKVLEELERFSPDIIVLAGFLWKFPDTIVRAFPKKIINIHPALLPKYGGKGMYGMHVHRAVLENGDRESGITIHYVNEDYDEGGIIFQQAIAIEECLSAEAVAAKVLLLEHEHFPKVIEEILKEQP